MNLLYFITSLLTAAVSLIIGSLVLIYNPRGRQNRLWFLLSLAILLWLFGLSLVFTADNPRDAFFWQKILYLGTTFIPVLFLHFCFLLTNRDGKNKIWLLGGYGGAVLFTILILFNTIIIGVFSKNYFGYWPVSFSSLYYFYLAYFAFLVISAVLFLRRGIKENTGIKKDKIKFVYYAALVGFIGGVFNFLLDFNFNYPIGNFFVSFYVVLIAYAIIRHRLMGIKMIASRAIVYLILIIFSLIFLTGIFLLASILSRANLAMFWLSVVIIISAAILPGIIIAFNNHLQELSDRLFFNGYNPRRIIDKLALKISNQIDIDRIYDIIREEFNRVLGVEDAAVIIYEDLEGLKKEKNSELADFEKIIFSNKILVRDELPPSDRLAQLLSKEDIQIISPLVVKGNRLGFIMLGNKKDGDGYSREEIEFIENISVHIALAVENALLYKKLEKNN